MPDLVRLGVFSPSVLLGVAARRGLPEQAGIRIEEVPARSSVQQLAELLGGELDAVLTSPDNLLAAAGSPAGAAEVRLLAAVDRGLGLSLFGAPGVGPAQLRGGVFAVDVARSGFAFVGYELLARLGLRAGRNYQVRELGTTPHRATALIAGECTMSVLNAGSDLRAEAAGCARIARASSLGPYLGTVLAAAADRVGTGPDATRLRALTTIVRSATRDLLADDEDVGALAAEVTTARLGLTGASVARHLRTLADPREGLVADGRVDPAALATLRRLRERHGAGGAELATLCAPGSPLVDDRFLAEPLLPEPGA